MVKNPQTNIPAIVHTELSVGEKEIFFRFHKPSVGDEICLPLYYNYDLYSKALVKCQIVQDYDHLEGLLTF